MPFSAEQFFSVFRAYNLEIWPVQILFYILGVFAILAVKRGTGGSSRATLIILSVMWAWNAVAYHFVQFAAINPMAWAFGAAFLVQSILLLAAAVRSDPPHFSLRSNLNTTAGVAIIAYAVIIYPALGWLGGRDFLAGPVFGVAPCPTTIFTLGILALTKNGPPPLLTAIPLIWAVIGSSAAILLQVPEDLGLAVAALTLLIVMYKTPHRRRSAKPVP